MSARENRNAEMLQAGFKMSRLYIAKAPSFSSLEAFVVCLSIPREGKGAFLQMLKAKCRELARADSSVLVAPTTDSLSAPFGVGPQLSLWLVTKNGNINNPKLREKLKQLELKIDHKVAVSYSILQACYQFTLVARLAPKWNQISNWLVKGSDFLITGKAQALSLEVGITGAEVTLTLTVHKLSLSFLKPEDLEATTSTLNQFFTDPQFVIRETSIYSNRCLLLPNFSVGYIFSASHQIPPSTELPNYDKVRLHWKKQHGVILPERQNLFYQVFFKSNPGKFFSYPGCCVYKAYPLVFPSKDTEMVASSFVADLHARMPSICGEPLRYSSKALMPFAQLHSATSYMALSNAKPAPVKTSLRPPGVSVPFRHVTTASLSTPAKVAQVGPGNALPSDKNTQPCQLVPSFIGRTQAISGGRVVPTFQPKSFNSSQKQQPPSSKEETRTNAAIVPTFNPTFPSRGVPPSQSQKREIQSTNGLVPNVMNTTTVSKVTREQQASGAKPPGEQRAQAGQVSVTKEQRSRTVPPPAKRPCLTPTATSLQQKVITAKQQTAPVTAQQVVPDLSQPECLDSSHDLSFTASDIVKPTAAKPTPSKPTAKPTAKQQISKNTSNEPKASRKTECPQIEGVSEDTMKKILKTKAALLKKWLQENGVKCRSKDKKDDLAKMAALHIRETGKTFQIAA